MLTAEQIELRRTGVTATDAAIIAGVYPYGRTVHDVYLEKLGAADAVTQTPAMALGHRLEPVALALLAEEFGLTIRPGKTEKHPIQTWCIASPDGDVLENDGKDRVAVAEAKAVGLRMAARWGESGDPETIPDEVRVQVAWQMIVTRTPRAHVVALLGTEARFYELQHDEDLAGALLEMGDTFYRDHILARVPPEVDGSEASARMVRGLFRRARLGLIKAPVEAEGLVRDYLRARSLLDDAERAKTAAQAKLCALIGEAEGIEAPGFVATWKARAGSPDWKALAEKLGATKALAEEYRRDGARVLNVKVRGSEAA
jgi:putative phage-type endonuclease